nr:Exoribonuclease 2 [Ipomoea batatas]GME09372.1 Exoribonuclease 2 [Ipomoea batatas]
MATAKLETRPACGTNSKGRDRSTSHLCTSTGGIEEAKLQFTTTYVPKMGSKLLMISVFVVDLMAFGLAVAAELKRNTICRPSKSMPERTSGVPLRLGI